MFKLTYLYQQRVREAPNESDENEIRGREGPNLAT